MRQTVRSCSLATHANPPPTSTPCGPAPTRMIPWCPVAVSTRVTVGVKRLVIHTAPSPTVRLWIPRGTTIWVSSAPVAGSSLSSSWLCRSLLAPARLPTPHRAPGDGDRHGPSGDLDRRADEAMAAHADLEDLRALLVGQPQLPAPDGHARRPARDAHRAEALGRVEVDAHEPGVAEARHPHLAAGDGDRVRSRDDVLHGRGDLRPGGGRLRCGPGVADALTAVPAAAAGGEDNGHGGGAQQRQCAGAGQDAAPPPRRSADRRRRGRRRLRPAGHDGLRQPGVLARRGRPARDTGARAPG